MNSWITLAKKCPIYFSQVREDASIDNYIIPSFVKKDGSLLMVASGGCTACALSQNKRLNHIDIVDPNQSQIALTQIKLKLLSYPLDKRLKLLGHKPFDHLQRKQLLFSITDKLNISTESLGDLDYIAENGLDYAGRYEMLFKAMQQQFVSHKKEIEVLCQLQDLSEQKKILTELYHPLKSSIDFVFSQENLVDLFGIQATQNRLKPFSNHFFDQLTNYLSCHKACSSPYISQFLQSCYLNQTFPLWFHKKQNHHPKIHLHTTFMQDFLIHRSETKYDVIHLSNIIDWLSLSDVEQLLGHCYLALKPRGIVIIRQLNSNLNIPQIGTRFYWDIPLSKKLHHQERSFFYRNLYIGKKS